MKERDKAFAIYNYVLSYFKYTGVIFEQDEVIYFKQGICVNYAPAYRYLLILLEL